MWIAPNWLHSKNAAATTPGATWMLRLQLIEPLCKDVKHCLSLLESHIWEALSHSFSAAALRVPETLAGLAKRQWLRTVCRPLTY